MPRLVYDFQECENTEVDTWSASVVFSFQGPTLDLRFSGICRIPSNNLTRILLSSPEAIQARGPDADILSSPERHQLPRKLFHQNKKGDSPTDNSPSCDLIDIISREI